MTSASLSYARQSIHQSIPKVDLLDSRTTRDWQEVAQRRRDEINNAIPKSYLVEPNLLHGKNHMSLVRRSGILTTRELGIIQLSATRLLERIHSRSLTSVEVATAFCKSAAIAHQATNCLAWIMFEECLADAAALDDFIRKTGKPKGPLHGLPISVKEHILFTRTPATSGMVAWADDFSQTDALIVKVFRDAGAVFHVKTTNPQGLMQLETVSNLYGTTTNPYNTNLSSGGSSGGESALIAMRGSVLGIGTDIGGSIRVPSAFCGLYGLKPSIARLPHGGLSGTHSGMENIIGVVGPMAATIEDMKLFCKIALDAEPWLHEPSLVELPWKASAPAPKKLTIGVMMHDGLVHPHPPITRCLQETIRSLEAEGHTVKTWDPVLHPKLIDCINRAYFLDGGAEYVDVMAAGNEPAVPLLKWILEKDNPRDHTAAETWKVNALRNALQIAYAAQWNESGIDALLCPINPSVASVHGESTYWGYSSVFNILDYSAVVFPVGHVQEGDSWARFPRAQQGVYMSENDRVYQGRYLDANMEGKEVGLERYRAAPVALQIVSRRYREEVLLGIVERVVEGLERSRGVANDVEERIRSVL